MESRPGTSLLLAGLLVAACGDGGGAPSEAGATTRGGESPEEVPPAERIGARAAPTPDGGGLYGEVRVTGDVPERFPIGARKNGDCTHFPEVEHLSEVVVAQDGKLQNVFVTLESGFDPATLPAPSEEPAVMDQVGCIYTPHVLGMRAGQTLLVKNSDPATHNVNLNAPRNQGRSNQGMTRGQEPLSFAFPRPDRVELKCDIHSWMRAWVHVERHPWFAVSGGDGGFAIEGVPPGTYVVRAEHELFGTVRRSVTIGPGEAVGIALTFAAD